MSAVAFGGLAFFSEYGCRSYPIEQKEMSQKLML
jgi:hypothetical protein